MTKIRDLRKASKLTQKQVAKRLDLSDSTVCMWETGRSMPRAEVIPKLATLYNCTTDDLLNYYYNEHHLT